MRNMLSVLLLLMLSMRHAEALRGGTYGPGLCQYFPGGVEICKSFFGLAFALFVACITVVEKNPDCMKCLGLLSAVPVLAAVPTYVFIRKEMWDREVMWQKNIDKRSPILLNRYYENMHCI